MARFQIRVKEGDAHGGLYELEQTTFYRVVDTLSGEVVMTFEGEMEASLGDMGLWDDYHFSGVKEVIIAPDEQSVAAHYYDGHEETFQLPR